VQFSLIFWRRQVGTVVALWAAYTRRARSLSSEEEEKIESVGYGGFPNIVGEMELDASFMNGDGRVVGAVAAVKNFLPIRIARPLMEKGPHARCNMNR
jgi:isoaspartyl peptidase/L-asparaginase-like protein (Ntn-hydrolase superfamily)